MRLETTHAWAIAAEAMPVIARYARGKTDEAKARAELEASDLDAAGFTPTSEARVAVIPLQGIITPRGSFFSMLTGGGGGLQAFREALNEAVTNDEVASILIPVNSPGGRVDLVAETAADVREATKEKSVIAVSSTLAASAAYWIGSQASEFVVSPSGDVGSIGVFTVHEDWSAYDEQMGIKTTLISAGRYKTAGNPFEPLSDEARAVIQEGVDEFNDQFVADVAAGRGATPSAVKAGYGQGACVGADRAVAMGLADTIETFEEVAARMVAEARGGRQAETPTPDKNLAGDGDEKRLLAEIDEQLRNTTESLKEG